MVRNLSKDLGLKIVIISRGRYDVITTTKLLPKEIEVVVPVSEEQKYREKIENPLVLIPDDQIGLGMVRNWCLDNFSEETLIMVDDDLDCLYDLTGEKTRRIEDSEEIMQVLINTAVMAKDSGAKFFCFSQTDIRKYNATEPFYLSRWIGGVVGVIGRQLRFRDDKFKVDIDFTLKNLLVNRIVWQDARYTFVQKRNGNKGGNSIFRTEREYKESVKSLQETWGRFINVSGGETRSDINITLNVQRKQNKIYLD